MQFNSEIFKRKNKCFRLEWQNGRYLTHDGENFIEHNDGQEPKIWYWDSAEEMQSAIHDLTSDDWCYIDNSGRVGH